MKRILGSAMIMAIALAGMAWSVSLAEVCGASFCVDASNSVNGKTTGVTVTYHSYANDSGSVKYKCWLGPIPFICDVGFIQTFAYIPFAKPSVTAGNMPTNAYVLGTSSATGQSGWNYKLSGTIAGDATWYLTGRAYADTHTGSGTYWNATGTGSGHMWDDNYKNRVSVP